MEQGVSARIYEAFFAKLSILQNVSPGTVASLRRLYNAGRLTSKQELGRLVQEMEKRHAQDQDPVR